MQEEQTFAESRKEDFLRELLFKVVEEQRLDSDFKMFNKHPKFLGSVYDFAFNSVKEKIYSGKGITTDFLAEHHGIVPQETRKKQHEIIDQLRSLFLESETNRALQQYQENIQKGKPDAYNIMVRSLRDTELSMQQVSGFDSDNDEEWDSIHDEILSGESYLNFGDNNNPKQDILAWNSLEICKGQLVAVFAQTKNGKSWVLSHIDALLKQQGYKGAIGNYEMSEKEALQMTYTQLGWYPHSGFKNISEDILKGFKYKYRQLYPKFFLVSQKRGRPDLLKIEKILDTFRPDYLILDYIFLLNESFDPVTTKVARDLKSLAQLYNCTIFTALNTNDEGRKTDEPPEITHIKWCKTIADDFDKIISFYSKIDAIDSNIRRTEFISKLIRQDKWVNWRVLEERNLGIWALRDCSVNGKTIFQQGNENIELILPSKNIDDASLEQGFKYLQKSYTKEKSKIA